MPVLVCVLLLAFAGPVRARMGPDRVFHVAPPVAAPRAASGSDSAGIGSAPAAVGSDSAGAGLDSARADGIQGADAGGGSAERPLRDLYKALDLAREAGADPTRTGATVRLAPGDYVLSPAPLTDSTCGNCEDPNQPVPATVGLLVEGRGIHIEGAEDHASVIHTGAGYGVFFRDCAGCVLRGVVLTGGERDTSGRATDAAVVVQRSDVAIEDCWIRDNIGDSAVVRQTVVGIIGIAGREGSRMKITDNRILRNSWDGIALYRDAEAVITNNVIDGVDLAVGSVIGGGRGVGIGVTWNARAEIRGNRVTRYWKGIGLFVDARGAVEENVVEHVATWGLSLWDAGKGRPEACFRRNAVDSTGACGAMLAADSTSEPGCLEECAFVRTGQNPKYDNGEPYCFQTAVAAHGVPARFSMQANLFFANREPGGASGSGDRDEAGFRRAVQPLCGSLARWEATRQSSFYRRYAASTASRGRHGRRGR